MLQGDADKRLRGTHTENSMAFKQLKDSGGNVYPIPPYKVVTKTGTVTFSNSDYAVASINLTDTGWTPVAFAGFRGGANTIWYRITYLDITGNTLTATIVNKPGTAETSTQSVSFKILYLYTG